MKRTNSFRLLGQAFKSAKEPMWASVQVLIVLTLVLATIFFIAEYQAQPEEYDYPRSLLWAFTRYIGDPGKFSGPGPVTFTGRLVACLIGIVGILIFAVPAGLVGGGFRTAIEKELRKKHLIKIGDKLKNAFSREQDSKTLFRFVPRHISLASLQAKRNMTERDVIDAVEYNPPFRLRNLGDSEAKGTHASDRLVVEMFPYNREPYGAMIDRGSNVTIACPSSESEAGIGNLGYYLALIGGFNFISKEIETDINDPVSFYLVADKESPAQLKEYLTDLKKLSKGTDHWTIFLISSERRSDYALHFITKANQKTGLESTVLDKVGFEKLYQTLSSELLNEFDLKCELDVEYRPVGSKNSSIIIGGGVDTNTFTIRMATELAVWDPRYLAVCKVMAEAINATIARANNPTPAEKLKEKGIGYQ